MSSHPLVPAPTPDRPRPEQYQPATVTIGWTITTRQGRGRVHRAWPTDDGDLTPAAAEALAGALLRVAVEARRGPDRSWTPTNQGR
jgi:hypothetical protein